ncbi:unnamed protein product [Caenorhabditis sp. 36 PRJEB53466]|nr:unnamed protein product [Caenorhabditis sp. 36 PRJEB53466]
MREARVQKHLEHPNVVKFYGVGAGQEPLYVIMELDTLIGSISRTNAGKSTSESSQCASYLADIVEMEEDRIDESLPNDNANASSIEPLLVTDKDETKSGGIFRRLGSFLGSCLGTCLSNRMKAGENVVDVVPMKVPEKLLNESGQLDPVNYIVNSFSKELVLKEQFEEGEHPYYNKVNEIMEFLGIIEKKMRAGPDYVKIDVARIKILGDLHGNFLALIRALSVDAWSHALLCLGDYVDRGERGFDVLMLLFCLYEHCPDYIFLLQGNHESRRICLKYGFHTELLRVFGEKNGEKLFDKFCDVFKCLPLAAIRHKQVYCCHGGPSSVVTAENIDNTLKRFPTNRVQFTALQDSTWSDEVLVPEHLEDKPVLTDSSRKCDVCFDYNETAILHMLRNLNCNLLVRAHQLIIRGNRYAVRKRLHSLFSSTNCAGSNNDSSFMLIENNVAQIILFHDSEEFVEEQKSDEITLDEKSIEHDAPQKDKTDTNAAQPADAKKKAQPEKKDGKKNTKSEKKDGKKNTKSEKKDRKKNTKSEKKDRKKNTKSEKKDRKKNTKSEKDGKTTIAKESKAIVKPSTDKKSPKTTKRAREN